MTFSWRILERGFWGGGSDLKGKCFVFRTLFELITKSLAYDKIKKLILLGRMEIGL